jgi:hypothetical protein
MHTFDKTLYADLSTNHQPIPVYFGAFLMDVIPYVTLFELIERLRLGMFLFFLLIGVGLVARFREQGLFAFVLTFSVGYYFFAWHVLAESLAVPAVLYLVLLCMEKLLAAKQQETISFQYLDSAVAGVAVVWLGFCLLPLLPFCLLVTSYLFWKFTKQQRIYAGSAALVATILIFSLISPIDWYRETVTNNLKYFIAYQEPLAGSEWVKILAFPFLPFLKPLDRVAQIFYVPFCIGVGIVVAYVRKHKKNISRAGIGTGICIYLLLIALNPRVYTFPVAFFTGFHLFPYVAGYFGVFASILFLHAKQGDIRKRLVLLSLLLPLFLLNTEWVFTKKDKLNEYYIQYGSHESYAQLVKVLKSDGDTFFSGPNGHGYLNIISELPIAGRQLFHLQWAYRSPQLRSEFHQLLATNPPEFIYMTEDTSGYHTDLAPVLEKEYREILQDDNRIFLYIRSDKAKSLSQSQLQYMRERDFSFTL